MGTACVVIAWLSFGTATVFYRRVSLSLWAMRLGAGSLTIALSLLGYAFLRGQFELAYVIDYARIGVSPVIRLGGLWAGPEGSLLLFTTILAWWALVVSRRVDGSEFVPEPLLVGVLSLLSVVVALIASPFVRAAQPLNDGSGLQPVLEHPAMGYHPPLLYAGLCGLLAVGLAIRLGGQRRHQLGRVALALAAIGLVSGSRWAFAEVGWGGYWAWDPIENGALVAWTVGLVALHAPARSARLLWVVTGIAALWSTVLTRIGVVSSVHAFANNPELRRSLLAIAVLTTVAVAVLARQLVIPTHTTPARKRSILGTAIMAAIALIIAVGTYKPLLGWVVSGSTSMVSGEYYSGLLWLPTVVGLVALSRADAHLWSAALGSVCGLALAGSGAQVGSYILVAAGGAVAGTGFWAARRRPRALAHAGIGLVLLGVGGSASSQTDVLYLTVDETVTWEDTTATHRGIMFFEEGRGTEVVATLDLAGTRLKPSVRTDIARGIGSAEVATHLTVRGEYHVVFQDSTADTARYQLTWIPLLGFVWLGGTLTSLGLLAPRTWRRESSHTDRGSTLGSVLPLVGEELV